MYAYYALALLKVRCPWKRYLTQAQLLQFTSVIIYSLFSGFSWPKEQRNRQHILLLCIQIWEMVSLFILFSIFYKNSYGKGKAKVEEDDDQCKAAMEAAVSGAALAVGTAAKETTKVASSAARSITEVGVQKDAVMRPSW